MPRQVTVIEEIWGPIFEKSCDELTKNLWKILTYKKT